MADFIPKHLGNLLMASAHETLQALRGMGSKFALRACNGKYVCAEGGGGGEVAANRDQIGPWETFTLKSAGAESNTPGAFALRTCNGKYVCAEGGGGGEVVANRDQIGPWETFTLEPAESGSPPGV